MGLILIQKSIVLIDAYRLEVVRYMKIFLKCLRNKLSSFVRIVFYRMMKNRVISLKDFMVLMMMMLLLLMEIYAHKRLCVLCIGFCIFFVDRYLFLSMHEKQKCLKLSS